MVLGAAFAVVAVGVDEQHFAPPFRRFGAFGSQDQDGGGGCRCRRTGSGRDR